ncbi:MAG: transketolase C-terminal domain-containing protein, partial [Pseudomonadota bacterium]
WDKAAVLASVEKTGRLIVAQEAVQVGGFGAEVAATVAERAHAALKAPVKRLGAPRAPIAYAPNLEDRLRVTPEKIADAARGLLQPA